MNLDTAQRNIGTSTGTTPRADLRRRTRALLAGGLVLGLGAAVTLAAWNDSEFATGEFAAGSFNLQGSVNGDEYTDHAGVGSAAELPFTVELSSNLSPGNDVYAPFWVRLDAATTTGADLVVADLRSDDGANAEHLSWTAYQLAASAPTCDEDGVTAGAILASGAALTDASEIVAGDTVALTEGATPEAFGDPVQLCIVVTADDDLVQGGSAVATWEFTATSTV